MRFIAPPLTGSTWNAEVDPSNAYRLVGAFLDLALGLLAAEKAAYFANSDNDSSSSETLDDDDLDGEGRSPLLACLTFCFEFLLEAGGSGNRTASNPIIPRLMQGSPSGKTGIFCLGKLHLACRVFIGSERS